MVIGAPNTIRSNHQYFVPDVCSAIHLRCNNLTIVIVSGSEPRSSIECLNPILNGDIKSFLSVDLASGMNGTSINKSDSGKPTG